MRIFVVGYPKPLGGGNTELWDTLKLWRSCGLDVTLIPTWGLVGTTPERLAELKALGINVEAAEPGNLTAVAGLPGSIVVSFCNDEFLAHASTFAGFGCLIVWVGCMCWEFPEQRKYHAEHGLFDRYVFQSRYQRDQITPRLGKYGWQEDDPRGMVIHGAFDPTAFPCSPRPHKADERFIIGRISRDNDDTKFPVSWGQNPAMPLWRQYARINHPFSARVMGWNQDREDRVGEPPKWAKCIPALRESPQAFYSSLHAMVPGIGCCAENWPRVGLEAMSAGVPIVAEHRGGWIEMLDDATGGRVAAKNPAEQAFLVERLAYDPSFRRDIIEWQRARLAFITEPQGIWKQWEALFQSLG